MMEVALYARVSTNRQQQQQTILGFPYDDFSLYPHGLPAPTL
jgi:hypothetical protein